MQLVIAILTSAAIILASPFMGQLQSFLRRSLSTKNHVLLFGVGVLAAVGAAVLIAFVSTAEPYPIVTWPKGGPPSSITIQGKFTHRR